MFAKPRRAFVGKPSLVASSSGSAKKARYARLLPSTRKSSESRAGPSSSCSSCPVSVFGTGPSYRLARDDAPRDSSIFRRVPPPRGRAPRRAPSRSPRGRAAAPGAGTKAPRQQLPRSRRSRGSRVLRAPSLFAAHASSASSSACARATRSGARTSGSRPPGTRSRRPRTCATCTAQRQRAGSRRAATATTLSSPRRIPLCSRPGRASASGSSTRTGSGRCPMWRWPEGVRLAEERGRRCARRARSAAPGPPVRWRPVFGGAAAARRPRKSCAQTSSRTSPRSEIGDLVAERDGRIVGAFQIVPAELSSVHVGLARPDGAALPRLGGDPP